MTLPVSGAISFNNINVELGVAGTTQASLGQTTYRNLAGVASGAISMSNFYGKANQFAFTISTNQTNANLRSLAVSAGWNQASKVVATINSGVIISSNSTGTPALTINGSFPGGVELVNNGTVVGMGGNGGTGGGGSGYSGTAGASGGTALSVSVATTVTNNGTLAGGGGGGGGGQSNVYNFGGKVGNAYMTGGGGGGGRSSNASNSSGGSGGSGASTGAVGPQAVGGTGGVGTYSAAGSGGAYGYYNGSIRAGSGGSGGAWGSSGSTGGNSGISPYLGPYSGGSGGAAASSGGLITWAATGTRYGGVS